MRSRYDLAKNSSTRGSDGSFYKDICTVPMAKFRYTTNQQEFVINSVEANRTDLLMHDLYQIAELDDLLLWLNNIADVFSLSAGDTISIPTKDDLESFYYRYRT